MAEVAFSIIGSNGDVIPLRSEITERGSFTLRQGVSGFGIPTPEASWSDSVADGATLLHHRTPPRDLVVPVTVQGATRSTTRANLRRLAAALRHRRGFPLPQLRAAFASGEALLLPFVYVSGAEDTYLPAELLVEWNLVFRAPDPFWQAEQWSTIGPFTAADPDAPALLDDLVHIPLAPSNAAGTLTVSNPGDADAWVVWEVTGEASRVAVSSALGGFEIEELEEGEVLTIDTRTNTVTDATGANRYPSLASVPRFFPLPPGTSTLTIQIDGSAPTATVLGRFRPRFEVIH